MQTGMPVPSAIINFAVNLGAPKAAYMDLCTYVQVSNSLM